ncbi:MAG: nuclear transport factor 2 family protein [Bacteroidota bacterium]
MTNKGETEMNKYKIVLIGSLVIALFYAPQICFPQESEAEKIMFKLFDAFNRHDADAMFSFYDENAMVYSHDYDTVRGDLKFLRENYSKMFKRSPNIKDEVKHYFVSKDGDEVAVEFVSTGTVQDLIDDDPQRILGRNFYVKLFTRLKIKNGKIIEDITYFDK